MKRTVLYGLVLALMIGLCGCGSNDSTPISKNAESQQTVGNSTDCTPKNETYLRESNTDNEIDFGVSSPVMKTEICFRSDGTIKYHYEYRYDEHGHLSEVVSIIDNGGSQVEQTIHKYEYDDAENVIKDYSSVLYQYEYDQLGNKVKLEMYKCYVKSLTEYEIGSYEGGETYEYNDEKQLIRQTTFDMNGGITQIAENVYDADGRRISCHSFSPDGRAADSTWTFEYDESGNLIKEGDYYEYQYNEDGRLKLKITNTNDGSVNEEYEYDEAGNIKKMTKYRPDGTIREWVEYEYDLP